MSAPGIFEVLAADDSDRRLASRRALVLARTRLDQRLGKFLTAAQSRDEFNSRYALVGTDFASIVRVAADEIGHDDPNSLTKTLRSHFEREAEEKWIQDAVKKPGDLHKKLHVPEGENIPESKIQQAKNSDSEDLKDKANFAENVKKSSEEGLEKEARMPKMCPYHHEIVDIALATGDPQAGYSTMSNHAWGNNHCQGSWEGGNCKFKREMVTQSYWDDRQQSLEEQRNQRAEQGQQNVIDIPQDDIEPGDGESIAPLPDEAEVIEFPSGDGGGESVVEPVADAVPLAAAASAKRKKADGEREQREEKHDEEEDDAPIEFTTGKVAADGNTDLGGPSPKMDKARWTPTSVKPLDVPSERHPTKQKDITEVMPKKNEGPPGNIGNIDEIGAQTTTETLPSEKENAGFQGGGEDFGPNTKTFPSDSRESDPVTSPTLEKV